MIHFVGLPSMDTHCEVSLPSKRTVASDGGWPAWSCVLKVPGSTTVGCGRSRSWPSQLGSGAARTRAAAATRNPSAVTAGVFIWGIGNVHRLGPDVHFEPASRLADGRPRPYDQG